MRAQIVPERQMVAPEIAARQREMNVVLPRIATPEKVAAGDPLFAPLDVVRVRQGVDCARPRCGVRGASEDVEDGFGSKAGNRGAARVLDNQSDTILLEDGV